MDFGFSIPTRGALATQQAVLALAQRGEQLGFTHLAIPDHIIIPHSIASPYPYNAARKMSGASDGDCLEQLAVLAYLAAATKQIRLLTSVMVAPHRPPVFTAKALATIDVLSNGRVDVGIGAGWMDEEFQAIGAPPFAERGKVTDEYLRCGPRICHNTTGNTPNFATSLFYRNRCKNPIPQSGSAAKVPPRYGA